MKVPSATTESLALRNQATAVILAGGLGTRIQHLLPGIPKPMAPVMGRPFLEWVVRYLARQGVRDMVISTGHLAESVQRHFDQQPVPLAAVKCIAESSSLGTAGGFLHAVRESGRTPPAWLVLNGDSLALAPIADLARALSDPAVAGAVQGVEAADASRYGTLVADAGGLLTGFQEKRPGKGVISAGVYLLRSSLLLAFPSTTPLSFERDVFPNLIRRGVHLQVCSAEVPFLDIGTPESLPQAESFIRGNLDQFEISA